MIIKENNDFNNQISQNIEKIRELFPNTVTESDKGLMIDFDKLKEELSSDLMDSKEERYQMTWPGKKASLKIANEPTDKTLIPDRESSVDFDNTQNIYIEGDNLDALKILKKSYEGKIKCIYIDPPYNTGNDYVYNDDFSEISEEYLKNTGIKNGEGETLSTNKETSGRFHSNWLTMMYPRLKIARDLLTNDGVIFISIDDNEQANLKKICDEIYGEENYIGEFIWEKHRAPKNDNKYITINHEYIFLYAKCKEYVKINKNSRSEENINNFSNPDNDSRGVWVSGPLLAPTFSKSAVYPITKPNGQEIYPPEGKSWSFTYNKLQELIKDNRIWFGKNGTNVPRIKRFLSELPQEIGITSVLTHDTTPGNQRASNYLTQLFDNKKIFYYSKPYELISKMISTVVSKDDIVLDFFSGSATTAESVLRINSENTSNYKKLKYILVQLQEKITQENNPTAFEFFGKRIINICEIGKERIRRSGKKIKEETNADIDYGFKVFKVSDSILNPNTEISPNTLTQEALNFENIRDFASTEDLLYFSILKTGRPLDSEVIKESIGKNEFFTVLDSEENKIIVACFDKEIEFNDEIIKMIADKNPLRVYFRDSSFKTDNDKINFEQKLKELSSESIEIYVLWN